MKSSDPAAWATISERGSYWALRLGVFLFRLLGRKFFLKLTPLFAAYYLVTHRAARQASYEYLNNLHEFARSRQIKSPAPTLRNRFLHFLSFAQTAVDKVSVWTGDMAIGEIQTHTEPLRKVLSEGKGAVLFSAHAGNVEVMRGVAKHTGLAKVNALMFTKNAERFNRILKELNPESSLRVVSAETISVETAIDLESRLETGECIALLADRVSAFSPDRVVPVTFLGKTAYLPEGPFILASLMSCPVFLCWSFRRGNDYHVEALKFADRIEISRSKRREAIQEYAQRFAFELERVCLEYPLQWYNFYRFWVESKD